MMSEDDDERVEYRLSTTGKLVNATPERIEDLMRLRADREKLSRPRPQVSFDAVLATAQSAEGAPDPQAESLARSRARQERAQAMARAGLQPTKVGAPGGGGGRSSREAGLRGAPPAASCAPALAAPTSSKPAPPSSPQTDVARFAPVLPRTTGQQRRLTNLSINPKDLPAAPPAREATMIRAAPVAKNEPTKGPPPKAPPRAGGSRRTIIKG